MCGRYVLTTPGEVLAQIFDTAPPPEEILEAIVPRYNIAPTQKVPIVRQAATGERELALAQWGLVPHWAKDSGDRQQVDQRAGGDRGREALLPRRDEAPKVPHSGRRLLRMAKAR